jgi:hypothetical protein
MSSSGETASGGAATAMSPEGDLKLIFKLDKSWIVRPSSPFTSQSSNQNQSNIDRFTPFNPITSDIKLSINLIVDGVITNLLNRSSNLAYDILSYWADSHFRSNVSYSTCVNSCRW